MATQIPQAVTKAKVEYDRLLPALEALLIIARKKHNDPTPCPNRNKNKPHSCDIYPKRLHACLYNNPGQVRSYL